LADCKPDLKQREEVVLRLQTIDVRHSVGMFKKRSKPYPQKREEKKFQRHPQVPKKRRW